MASDPWVTGRHWQRTRAAFLAHHARIGSPCTRCAGPIDYDAPRGTPTAPVAGHIVDRHTARRIGWTRHQTNHPSNLQPECYRCSCSSGATLQQQIRAGTTDHGAPTHVDDDW